MGLTFDTGALIGLERSRHYMRKVFHVAVTNEVRITVPAVVVAEWWRLGRKETDVDDLEALRHGVPQFAAVRVEKV
jgi:hypothetical protein